MALSLKEKRTLQKTVAAKQLDLSQGGLKIKEKRKVQKALKAALEKLTSKEVDIKTSPTLEKLIAGDYDNLPPIRFLSMLEKAVKELDGDVEPVKPVAIAYIDKNKENMDIITESAIQGIFSGMAGPGSSGSAIRYQPMDHTNPEGPKHIIIDIDHEFSEPSTFRGIVQALETAIEGDQADLKINSPGGRTDAAQAVYVALLETKARTKAKIINAASSGSIVAMACDEIEVTPFGTMMIHNASAGAQGKVGDMAAAASHYRDHFKDWFEQLYAGFMTSDEIADVAKGQEFYLTEKNIKARLKGWVPIRARSNDDLTVEA